MQLDSLGDHTNEAGTSTVVLKQLDTEILPMELHIEISQLLQALTLVQGVAQRKSSMPVLSHVLLQASNSQQDDQKEDQKEEGHLSFSATDLETSMQVRQSCQVQKPGAATVPVRSLLDLVRNLPGPQVFLSCTQQGQLQVRSGRVQAQLLALPADEFPQLPQAPKEALRPLPVQKFADMITKTLYCTSTSENQFVLTGVCCHAPSEGPGLVLVAIDGHRLSRVQETGDTMDLALEQPVILPRKGLAELLRLLQQESTDEKAVFQFGFLPGQAMALCGGTLLTMRLIEGVFPDYAQVIPTLSDKLARASRPELLSSLRRTSALASDKYQSLKWTLNPGELTMHYHNPETGDVSDRVAVEYDGPQLEIGLNARYTLEALSSIEDDNVFIRCTDSSSPVLLSGMQPECHQCVVMPTEIS